MGVFGKAVVGFRDFAFLTVTGRNDWDSRLNKENNKALENNEYLQRLSSSKTRTKTLD